MIKNIIFDFGDVFIDLDKSATLKALQHLGKITLSDDLQHHNNRYEVGEITTSEFINHYKSILPNTTAKQLIEAWNAILIDFPIHRLHFIQQLALEKKYRLILLSNTNELHIDWIKNNISFYSEFKECFDAFYLSHEIHLRKPTLDIYRYVLKQHQLIPSETLFIDDTKTNTDAAKSIGIHTWNNDPKKEDVVNLFTSKSHLF